MSIETGERGQRSLEDILLAIHEAREAEKAQERGESKQAG